MNRLVLNDYLRRKRWMLGLGAGFFFALNWATAAPASRGWASSLQVFYFQIALFCGPFLLSLDLKRGYARVLHGLPITAKAAGRAWWVGAVLLPAGAAIVLIFTATALADAFTSGLVDYGAAVRRAGTAVLLLGAGFGLLHTFPFQPGKGWRNLATMLAAILGGVLMTAGWVWWGDVVEQRPYVTVAAVVAAVVLTWRGWTHAHASLQSMARLPAMNAFGWAGWMSLGTSKSRRATTGRALYTGCGGVTWWLARSCGWVLLGLAAFLSVVLLMHLLLSGRDLHVILLDYTRTEPVWAMFLPMLGMLPALNSMRTLRTLPMGAGALAAYLLAPIVLPIVMAGLLQCGIANLLHGPEVMLRAAHSLYYGLGVACLVAPFAIWRGVGWLVYAVMMGGMFFGIFVLTFTRISSVPAASAGWDWVPGFALGAVAFGWFLTWLVLNGSRHVYQRPSNLFMAWNGGPR